MLQYVMFREVVINAMLAKFDKVHKGIRWSPTKEDVDTIYKGTMPGSPARHLMVDTHVWYGKSWVSRKSIFSLTSRGPCCTCGKHLIQMDRISGMLVITIFTRLLMSAQGRWTGNGSAKCRPQGQEHFHRKVQFSSE